MALRHIPTLLIAVLVLGFHAALPVSASRMLLQSAAPCLDRPTPEGYTCLQQRMWGKCSAPWMTSGGFCRATCGACGSVSAPVVTADAVDSIESIEESIFVLTDAPTPEITVSQPRMLPLCSWLYGYLITIIAKGMQISP